ncbi:MAG: hypothetical protein RMM08_01965 [Armatimonadota bacterium]|nr:hypothetical protein [Armatimonadota bacterium]
MKCPKCGAEVREGLAACSVCFAPLTGEEAERVAKLAKEAPQPTPQARRTVESAPRGSTGRGGGAAAAILVVILLAVIGAASWYYFVYMRSPQYAARQFLEAMKTSNYEQIYQSCVWTGLLAGVQSGRDVERVFGLAKRMGFDVSIQGYEIKAVEVRDSTATVKTSVVRGNNSDDWDLTMVKGNDGKWKCDLFSSILSAIGGSLRLPSSLPGLDSGR